MPDHIRGAHATAQRKASHAYFPPRRQDDVVGEVIALPGDDDASGEMASAGQGRGAQDERDATSVEDSGAETKDDDRIEPDDRADRGNLSQD